MFNGLPECLCQHQIRIVTAKAFYDTLLGEMVLSQRRTYQLNLKSNRTRTSLIKKKENGFETTHNQSKGSYCRLRFLLTSTYPSVICD